MEKNNITSYSEKINPAQSQKLASLLKERGWEFSTAPHASWRAKKLKTNVVAYESGKLLVQGKETEEFVTFILEPEILKEARLGYENVDPETGKVAEFVPHAGIDESGKGDFFGPLVIATVFVDYEEERKLLDLGVKDSKVIKSDKKIRVIADKLRNVVGGNFATVPIGPEAYNRLYNNIGNLNRLLAWGHARALENLLEKVPQCNQVLADKFGNESLIRNALLKKGQKVILEQKTKAESDIAVAAASILARDVFVRGIERLGENYGVVLPKGASAKVIEVGELLVAKHGPDILDKVAKTHFKTSQKILDNLL